MCRVSCWLPLRRPKRIDIHRPTAHVRAKRGREHATLNSTEHPFAFVADALRRHELRQSVRQVDERSESLIVCSLTRFASGLVNGNCGRVDCRWDTRWLSASRRGSREATWRLRSCICGSGHWAHNLLANGLKCAAFSRRLIRFCLSFVTSFIFLSCLRSLCSSISDSHTFSIYSQKKPASANRPDSALFPTGTTTNCFRTIRASHPLLRHDLIRSLVDPGH